MEYIGAYRLLTGKWNIRRVKITPPNVPRSASVCYPCKPQPRPQLKENVIMQTANTTPSPAMQRLIARHLDKFKQDIKPLKGTKFTPENALKALTIIKI